MLFRFVRKIKSWQGSNCGVIGGTEMCPYDNL